MKANRLATPYEHTLQNKVAMVYAAQKGVPIGVFFELVDRSGYRREQLAGLLDLSLKTLVRYHQEDKKLSPANSELVLKLTALFQKGEDVFGTIAAFRRWLEKPAFGLGEQVPYDLLTTAGGIDLVMDELVRIEFGDLA